MRRPDKTSLRPARGTRIAGRLGLLLLVWGVATGGILDGCDGLFRPATPEAPAEGSGVVVPLIYAPEPDDALETFGLAIAAKNHGNGEEAYLGALSDGTFADPFTATFDSEVANRHEQSGSEVPLWTRDLERNFYGVFAGVRSENYLMRWTDNEVRGSDEIGVDEALLYRKYQVFLIGDDGSTLGLIAVGTADLHFRRDVDTGQWAIVLWEDGVDPDFGINPDDPEHQSFSQRRLDTQ